MVYEVNVTRIIDLGIYTYLSSTFKPFSSFLLLLPSQYQCLILPHKCFLIPIALSLELLTFLYKRLQLSLLFQKKTVEQIGLLEQR